MKKEEELKKAKDKDNKESKFISKNHESLVKLAETPAGLKKIAQAISEMLKSEKK